jgi:hypothetical protein
VPRQSILRDREAVSCAVSQSQSIAQALGLLGLRPAGGNYRALHQACGRFGLAVPVHARTPQARGPSRPQPTKISWPSDRKLRLMVAASSYAAAGRRLGVSDTAVRKRLRRPAAQSACRPVQGAGAVTPYRGRRRMMLSCLQAAMLVIAGLGAGCGLVLAIRSGSRPELAEASAVCLFVLAAALACPLPGCKPRMPGY